MDHQRSEHAAWSARDQCWKGEDEPTEYTRRLVYSVGSSSPIQQPTPTSHHKRSAKHAPCRPARACLSAGVHVAQVHEDRHQPACAVRQNSMVVVVAPARRCKGVSAVGAPPHQPVASVLVGVGVAEIVVVRPILRHTSTRLHQRRRRTARTAPSRSTQPRRTSWPSPYLHTAPQ